MTFVDPGGASDRVGLVHDESVLALPAGAALLDLLGDDGSRLRATADQLDVSPAEVFALADVRPRPPIPRPPSMRDFMCFEQHVQSGARQRGITIPDAWYRYPAFYFSNPQAMIGGRDDVPVPPGCSWFDFELEVACIVGRAGSDLTPDQAIDHIAGYTIMCDWSARDVQFDEMVVGLGPAKGKDTATTLGPFLVTPDELAPYAKGNGYDLAMRVAVNGEQLGEDRWSSIHWSFAEMVAYASRGTTVVPGEVFGSGTCGFGCLAELREGDQSRRWLAVGDEVRLDIEQLGATTNRVVAGVDPVPIR